MKNIPTTANNSVFPFLNLLSMLDLPKKLIKFQLHFFLNIVMGSNKICVLCSVCSVADPDPGTFRPLDPGSGLGKKSGSGIRDGNNPDYISESFIKQFFELKCLIRDRKNFGSGMEKISDPGWKKFGSGINIPDPQHLVH
jgi:hypothetical protein